MRTELNITYIIMGITVAVSLWALGKPTRLEKLMMNPYRIKRSGEYYRFLTSGFIHINHAHLLLNMFSFYFFGPVIERIFEQLFGRSGSVYYVVLYLAAIVVSDLPTYFKQKDNTSYNSLGASGAVSAIIFAFIIFLPIQSICIFIAICMPGFILGVLYIGFSYYQGKRSSSSINHEAHLYGALFGLLFCILAYPPSIGRFITQVQDWVSGF